MCAQRVSAALAECAAESGDLQRAAAAPDLRALAQPARVCDKLRAELAAAQDAYELRQQRSAHRIV